MISINIVCVGNLKEKFWKDAINEYSKRISAFAKISIFEVKESIYGISDQEILKAKKEEALRLEKFKSQFNVALEIKGEEFTSEEFADKIKSLMTRGTSSVSFFVGGSFGLDKVFSDSLNLKLSFSNFTFPHQLMRVILIEQIYRAFTIINGKTYHK